MSNTIPATHSLALLYTWIVHNIENPIDNRYIYSANKNSLTLTQVARSDADINISCKAKEDVRNGYTSDQTIAPGFEVLCKYLLVH